MRLFSASIRFALPVTLRVRLSASGLALGLILMASGWIWNRSAGVDGRAELRPGTTTGFQGQSGSAKVPDFQVRLETLDIAPRADYRLYAYTHPNGKGGFEPTPTALEVQGKEGKTLEISKDYALEVERLIPDAVDHGRFMDDPKAPLNPMLSVLLGLGLPEPLGGRLFAQGGPQNPAGCRQDEPGGRFAVVLRTSVDPAFLTTLKACAPLSERVVLAWEGRLHEISAKPGARLDLGGGMTLRVVKLYPDFAVRDGQRGPEAYSRSQESREPWLEASLSRNGAQNGAQNGAADQRLLLCARDPGTSDRLNAPNLPVGMQVRYVRSGEETQRVFVVFSLLDRQVRLVQDGRVLRQEPWSLEQPFVVARGLSVTPMTYLEHAVYVPDFVPAPPEAQKIQKDQKAAGKAAGVEAHPVMRVRVFEKGGSQSDGGWLEAKGVGGVPTAATFLGDRVALVYRARDPEPGDYRGTVVVLEGSRVLARQELSVQKPLQVQGYQLVLDEHVPDDPAAMGLRLIRHPGKGLLGLGAIFAFLGGTLGILELLRVLKARNSNFFLRFKRIRPTA